MPDNISALAVLPPPDPSKLSPQDISFLKSAQASNLAELQEAGIVLTHTSSVTSREFAEWMMGDHSAQSATVTALARQLGVSLPTAADAADQAEAARLGNLTGTAFDQAYAADGVAGHAATIALLQQEVSKGSSPTLVALAKQSLPLVQAHYEQANILAGKPDPGPGPAAPPPPAADGTRGASLSQQDQIFISQAASGNALEIAEGKVAIAKGNPQTAELGRWLSSDHTAANAALTTLGSTEGFTVPTTLTPEQQGQLTSLQNTPSSDLEGTFVSDQLVDQSKVLLQFITEAKTGSDAGLMSYAQSAIPVLEQHLVGATELKLDSLGLSPAGGKPGDLQTLIAASMPDGSKLVNDLAGFITQAQNGGSANIPAGVASAFGHDIQQISALLVPHTS